MRSAAQIIALPNHTLHILIWNAPIQYDGIPVFLIHMIGGEY